MKKTNFCLIVSAATFFSLSPLSLLAAEESSYEVETLKLEGGTDWGTPNPFLHQSRGPGQAKAALVYGSLLEKDENGDIGWLAKDWTVKENVFTFTLYDDLTFHDGDDLTTEDVAFSLDYYKEFPPVSNSLGTGEDYLVQSYEIIDDQTIAITAEEVSADTCLASVLLKLSQNISGKHVDDPYTYTGDGYLTGSGAYMCTPMMPPPEAMNLLLSIISYL